MKIRYFAGAAAAAGVAEEVVEAGDLIAAELVDRLGSGREHLTRVLAVSTLLVNGQPLHDRNARITADANVDVLPPFAGG